jgi:lysine-N-methylase
MSLPIRTLPIIEKWDCHNCGICCRGTIINLRDDDLARIRSQHWEEHPEYRGVKVVTRHGLFPPHYRLAKRPDGSCVFLTPEGRCRVHELHGAQAKPLVCQLFPLQIIPLEEFAYLTLRRFCPSAAADHGRPVEEHSIAARDLLERWQAGPKPARPPSIVRGQRAEWQSTLAAADVFTRLMLDIRYPLVRRLVHGILFGHLLERCRLDKLEGGRLVELLALLETTAIQEAGDLFHNRIPPGKQAAALFRQTALEHLRLHPQFTPETSWRERWLLLRAAVAFSSGKGKVPDFHLPFPEATFESLERPLGPLSEEILHPLDVFFQTAAASLRYAMVGRHGWSLADSFRGLALAGAIGLWTLRLACGERSPGVEDMSRVVMMLDRGLTYDSMLGRRHQLRIAGLARKHELARAVVWYAR